MDNFELEEPVAMEIVLQHAMQNARKSAEWEARAPKSRLGILRLSLSPNSSYRMRLQSVCSHHPNTKTRLFGPNEVKTAYSNPSELFQTFVI